MRAEHVLLAAMAALVAGLLVAEARHSAAAKWATKPFASAAFVALALVSGATGSAYGLAVLVALVFAAAGDVLLIPSDRRAFLVGIVSFLLGHAIFAAAFASAGASPKAVALAAAALALPAAVALRWVLPHAGPRFRVPVVAYVLVISLMLAMAVGAAASRALPWWVAAAALAFYLSDLAVARNRFVAPAYANRLVGLPLYYGAQAALALSVAHA